MGELTDAEKRNRVEAQGVGDEGLRLEKAQPVTNGGAGRLPTVKIRHDDHPDGLTINQSDFDPEVHELFDKPKKAKKSDDGEKGGSGEESPAGGATNPAGGAKGGGKPKK